MQEIIKNRRGVHAKMAAKKVTKKTTKTTKATAKPAAKKVTKKTATKTVAKQVTFKFIRPESSAVSVVGDFNSWNPEKNVMKKTKSGEYSARLSLKPGRYNYKYLASDGWYTDPQADLVCDEQGNQNSLVVVA